jgi:multiple sugar transport system permease protein
MTSSEVVVKGWPYPRPAPRLPIRLGARRRRRREALAGIVLLAPILVLLLVFSIAPIVYGAQISLFDWSGITAGDFVGVGNFAELFADEEFYQSLSVTLWYMLLTVPVELALGLLLAVAIHRRRRRSLYLIVFFLPQVISLVAVGLIARWVFRSGDAGLVNSTLGSLNLPQQAWLQDPTGIFSLAAGSDLAVDGPSLALVIISVFTVWFYTGFHVVIYTAGLTAIPQDLYDAAQLDGATKLQQFWRVTVPLLSPTTYMLMVLATIGSLQSFTLVFAIGGGSYGASGSSGLPLGTTRVLTLFIFDNFYRFGSSGYAMAAAVVLFLLILTFTLVQRRVAARYVNYLN